jgi:LysR family cyn operon transcriptional activator
VHLSQSTVRQQIRQLEDLVGKLLFERDTRTVTLTRDGEALQNYAARIWADFFRIIQHCFKELLRLTRIEYRSGMAHRMDISRLVDIPSSFETVPTSLTAAAASVRDSGSYGRLLEDGSALSGAMVSRSAYHSARPSVAPTR